MIITQDNLIKEISIREDIDVTTVRKVFKSAENIIFAYLSSESPIENMIIKLFNGLSINRKYIESKKYSRGMFKDVDCPEHVNISCSISKYYKNKINNQLFDNK